MADVEVDVAAAGQPKKRTFKKFSFRGVDLDALLDMSTDELVKLFSARARRRFQRGLTRKPMALIKKLRKAADVEVDVAAAGQPKKRTFKKFSFRGVDLDALLDMSTDELVKLFSARARRRFQRGLTRKPMALIKKLRKAKREAPAGEKPEPVRTHLRNMIIVPEMIGSIIGVYNGKTFNQVEIKPEMIGHYLAEFSISYKPVKHGRPGIGATHSSRFIPLK
ncbi:small subunit ribosomal protein S15e [Vigna unguiculata]|uniref:Small subunit ribosomal protein S15e n=1 Tax=Vigna unguiculata TaxID=3917 RepID=A0A4D6LA08_VIGUN|nr:small subunit ribosomal protein S15e [Vigna unguiculata]